MEKHISLAEKKKKFEALKKSIAKEEFLLDEAWREMDKKSVNNKDLYEIEKGKMGEIEESGRIKRVFKE